MKLTLETIETLHKASKDLVDAVSFDVNGKLIGGIWMGGNGGLVSRETIAACDATRRALDTFEKEMKDV